MLFTLSGGVGTGAGSHRPEAQEGTGSSHMYGTGHCKWFNVRMGFGFISMTNRGGTPIDPPMDVFVHQVSPASNEIKHELEGVDKACGCVPEA